MSQRALYLDRSPGEVRGVVTLDGAPERLLIERDGEPAAQRLGAISMARVRRIEKGLGAAFLEMPGGADGTAPTAGLVEGRLVEVEVAAEARSGKGPVLRVRGPGEGEPRLLRQGPSVPARLAVFAPGVRVVEGASARAVADDAEEAALLLTHPLPGGGSVTIEATQALTAVDVDMGGRGGGDARYQARQANLSAIGQAARLLRLKGLGGLVVIDLVGKGHDGTAMSAAAKAAFAADGPAVSIGPISRFGLFELSLPRTMTPIAETLTDGAGRLSALSCALRLMRALEREARADPGGRLVARCAPDVAEAAASYNAAMNDLIGARFSILAEAGRPRDGFEVAAA